MKKHTPSASLFQGLTPEQIAPLIQEKIASSLGQFHHTDKFIKRLQAQVGHVLKDIDLSTLKHRVHINYVLDPYDIMEYCFPFGFRMQNKIQGDDLDRLSDRLTAWDDLYTSSSVFILMDQHRTEMGRLRNRLVHEMSYQVNEFDQFERLVQDIYNIKLPLSEAEEKKLHIEIFQKRLPWLIAAATSQIHEGPNRYRTLFKKMIVNVSETDERVVAPWLKEYQKQEHIGVIQDVFRNTKSSRNAIRQYLAFVDNYEGRDIELDDFRKESALEDYKAADRLIQINEQFAELADSLQCRYIFLYLGSDNKFEWRVNDDTGYYPHVFDRPMNFYRNVRQLYLKFLNKSNTSETQTPAEREKSIYDYIDNLVFTYGTYKNRLLTHQAEINEKVSLARERVVWTGLVKNIAAYPEKLRAAFDDLKNRSTLGPLKMAFEDLIEITITVKSKEQVIQYQKEIRNLNILVTVFQKIISVLDTNVTPDISSLGYIVGINHHLPTLIVKANGDSKYDKLIDRIILIILSPNTKNDFSSELKAVAVELKNFLLKDKEELGDLQAGFDPENLSDELKHYERQCLLYLFALILPASNLSSTEGENYNLDSELDDLLLFDINTLTRRLKNIEIPLPSRDHIAIILHNLQYIRVWSLRRNNELEKCQKFIQEAIQDYPELSKDIRFVHGESLLNYSRLLELLEDERVETIGLFKVSVFASKTWKKAEQSTIKALRSFTLFDTAQFDPLVLRKTQSAILNTLIYLEVLGYGMTEDYNRLRDARRLVDEEMIRFEVERRSHPEYLHSEAHLEYYEAIHYLNGDRKKAYMKIQFANLAIRKCIELFVVLFPNKPLDDDYQKLEAAIILFKTENF
ncbi:hypothetical protein ACFGVS_00700 [Mucilaginibacter sp. AW1-7]|uniref:hypothetical protein n=1 Tax=Mucilaginibacter sp. AW1-7 TaxID=3349874 RepID=UPI003F73750C